jgi:hypothetical protein
LQDYYVLLGLDPNASPESIKVAYRRLARESHPDRNLSLTETEKAALATNMVQLNEAYAVLSHAKRRTEYDEQLRVQTILAHPPNTTRIVATQTRTTTKTVDRPRVRPSNELAPALISQFSDHIRSAFLPKKGELTWKVIPVEGFEWGVEGGTWSAHFCVALRGFATLDPTVAKKFITYSEIAIPRQTRSIRKNYFLFLLPFLQLNDWETVSHLCQKFVGSENQATLSTSPRGMVLFDMHHGRSVRFGAAFREKRLEHLLQSIRTPSY